MGNDDSAGERPSVFLSYARADDEPFVERLHEDLKGSGIDVWWDRMAMKSRGRSFLQEIRDAIEQVDRVVAVIGPQAVASQYVRYEWEHASLFAKAVVPILRVGSYDLIPNEMFVEDGYGLAEDALNRRHAEDFRDNEQYGHALKRLVDILRKPVPKLGSIDGTPMLPPHFLPRRDDIKSLQGAVLADVRRPTVITSSRQTVALQGMGGVGKSVLAAAFARMISTRRVFGDGIIWLTAGERATPLSINNNIKAIGLMFGDHPARYADDVEARQRLPVLLADKVCLIILDDLWSMDQAQPILNALGPRCRLLITTRNGSLVTSLGANELSVDVLPDDMALALLAEWSDQKVADLTAEARSVAEECGNLPLALAMVGAMVRGKPNRWRSALHRLKAADLEKIKNQFPNYPYHDLLKAIGASVNALDPEVRARYLEFAVFPEDTPIPEAALAVLWEHEGLNEYDSQDVVDTLVDLSLARRDEQARITLHDLQRDYVLKQLQDLPALHCRLIAAYRSKCRNGWASGPNDGYFFQFLPYHFAQAQRRDELIALLLDYRWLATKLSYTDPVALMADCEYLPEKKVFTMILQALRLSAPVLAQHPDQLASHLMSRLLGCADFELHTFLSTVAACLSAPWLRPTLPALTPPGGPLLSTIKAHSVAVKELSLIDYGESHYIASLSTDGTFKLWDPRSLVFLLTIGDDGDSVLCFSTRPKRDLMLIGRQSGRINIIRLGIEAIDQTICNGAGPIIATDFIGPDVFFSISSEGTVCCHEVRSGNCCARVALPFCSDHVVSTFGDEHTNRLFIVHQSYDLQLSILGLKDQTFDEFPTNHDRTLYHL